MKTYESLTEQGKVQRHRRALLTACSAYPILVRDVRFVSFESKPVFRIFTDAGTYAAKFHEPSEHKLSQLVGEMQFLRHVGLHTDLCVETPLANADGEYVTAVDVPWLPARAHVVVCTWVPGRVLRNELSPGSYGRLGHCAARLHEAALTFRPDPGFDILRNDRVFYWDPETILSKQDSELLPRRRQRLFREGERLAGRAIRRVWRSSAPLVVHNDLHPCNVKVHHGSLSLYDFEDIAWGLPVQDIGAALYYVRFRKAYPELLHAFREGYESVRAWPPSGDAELDVFVIARLLMFANYVVNYNIEPQKWLPLYERRLRALLRGGAA